MAGWGVVMVWYGTERTGMTKTTTTKVTGTTDVDDCGKDVFTCVETFKGCGWPAGTGTDRLGVAGFCFVRCSCCLILYFFYLGYNYPSTPVSIIT